MKATPVYVECYNTIGGRTYHGVEKSISAAIRVAKSLSDFCFSYVIFSEDKKRIIKRGFCV